MNIYDEILDKCTCYNEYHPEYGQPFRQEQYVVATTGTIIVLVRKDKPEELYEYGAKPDARKYMHMPINRNVSITIEQLRSLYDRIPMTNKRKCEACNGTGEVDYIFEWNGCNYTITEECPICDGDKMVEIPYGETIKDDRYFASIGDGYFHLKFIEKLICIVSTAQVEEIVLCAVHDRIATFIINSDITVVAAMLYEDMCDEEFLINT